jgi:putative flippase GtrA
MKTTLSQDFFPSVSNMSALPRKLWDKFGMQAVKFCIVGGTSLAFGSMVLYALTEYVHIWYLYSNWIAVILAQLFAFCGYKYWAFTVQKGKAAYGTRKQFVIHWIVWGVGLMIATVVIYSLTTYAHLWYIFSSWIASAISGASNFFSHRYWTYSTSDSTKADGPSTLKTRSLRK